MNLQLPKVISKDLARQVLEAINNDSLLDITDGATPYHAYSTEEVLAILFPDD